MREFLRKLFRRHTVFRMGSGSVLTAWGTLGGKPCVVLGHAPEIGVPGESADGLKPLLERGGTVILFEDAASLHRFHRLLEKLTDDIEGNT